MSFESQRLRDYDMNVFEMLGDWWGPVCMGGELTGCLLWYDCLPCDLHRVPY